MEINNLQDLATEILNNGVSLSAVNYIYIALIAMVSSALGAYFGSYFKKRGEEQALNDSFEDVKARLEATTKISEEIKSSISIGTLEHQIKFSKLHEKRIAVIEGLYHRLVDMETKGKDFVYHSGPAQEIGPQFDVANKAINEFISYSKLNKFWVDKDLFDEIEKVALRLDAVIHGAVFHCHVSPSNTVEFQKAMDDNRNAVDEITQEIPKAKDKVIESIRNALEPGRL